MKKSLKGKSVLSKTKKLNSSHKKTDKMNNKRKIPAVEMNVQEPWFSHIKAGRKSIEGRLNKGKFASLKKGQYVRWSNNGKSVLTKITDIRNYKTFGKMLINEGLRNVLPDTSIKTLEDGEAVYYGFYTREKEAEFGILAIELVVV